jgi:hypothetical protein
MSATGKPERLTKRQFFRRVIVGSGTVMFVAGDYVRPELETLLGPKVARAHGSSGPPYGNVRGNGVAWGRGGRPKD